MDNCPHCGYDLYPLDTKCDRCGASINGVANKGDVAARKSGVSKKSRVFDESKSNTKVKSAKSSDKTKASSGKGAVVAETKNAKASSKNAKPEKKKTSVGKVFAIIGCTLGGIILLGGFAFLIYFTIQKANGNIDSIADVDIFEDIVDGIGGDYVEEITVGDYEEYIEDDDYYEDYGGEEFLGEDDNGYWEEDEFEEEEEEPDDGYYEEEPEQPIEGIENIGQTFGIGTTFSYDNVSYTATSFSRALTDLERMSGEEDTEFYDEDPDGEDFYQLDFTVVNNSSEEKDIDIMGSFYQNGEELDVYTADDKDYFAIVPAGGKADLAVTVYMQRSGGSREYALELGENEGDKIVINLN